MRVPVLAGVPFAGTQLVGVRVGMPHAAVSMAMRVELAAPPAHQQTHGQNHDNDADRQLGRAGHGLRQVPPEEDHRQAAGEERDRVAQPPGQAQHAGAAGAVASVAIPEHQRRERGQVVGIGRVPQTQQDRDGERHALTAAQSCQPRQPIIETEHDVTLPHSGPVPGGNARRLRMPLDLRDLRVQPAQMEHAHRQASGVQVLEPPLLFRTQHVARCLHLDQRPAAVGADQKKIREAVAIPAQVAAQPIGDHGEVGAGEMFERELEPRLELALEHLAGADLAVVADRLSRDLRRYGHGFPDLFLVGPDGRWSLVEVKAPGDVLRPEQEGWLEYLHAAGLPVSVLHLRWLDAKIPEIQRHAEAPSIAARHRPAVR